MTGILNPKRKRIVLSPIDELAETKKSNLQATDFSSRKHKCMPMTKLALPQAFIPPVLSPLTGTPRRPRPRTWTYSTNSALDRRPHFSLPRILLPRLPSPLFPFMQSSNKSDRTKNDLHPSKKSKRQNTADRRKTTKTTSDDRPILNRFLSSPRLAGLFLIIAAVGYVCCMLFLARVISVGKLFPHQRVLLMGLAVLLPDFRFVLRAYENAVKDLYQYKPAFQGFWFQMLSQRETEGEGRVKEGDAASAADGQSEDSTSKMPGAVQSGVFRPSWLSDAIDNFQTTVQEKLDESATKFETLLSQFERDVAKPLSETTTTIQQLTTRTDLTLRKNVVIAFITISLSIAGYISCIMKEVTLGGVAIMLACLLPSAMLEERRHELLQLVNDARVVICLVGTLSSVMTVLFPTAGAYIFLVCCTALVILRYHPDWLRHM